MCESTSIDLQIFLLSTFAYTISAICLCVVGRGGGRGMITEVA